MRAGGITVLKLGGSLAGSRHLIAWLKTVLRCGGGVVIVPGGGPFADAVRTAQMRMGFGDRAAHRLALLGMEQYGLALATLAPGLSIASSAAAIRRILRQRGVPIWSPANMVWRQRDIPASWDITSDSLAAWLAGYMHARQLVLVKHGVWTEPQQAVELVRRGIVDPAFRTFLAASGVPASIVATDAYTDLGLGLRGAWPAAAPIGLRRNGATRLHSVPWPKTTRRVGVGR